MWAGQNESTLPAKDRGVGQRPCLVKREFFPTLAEIPIDAAQPDDFPIPYRRLPLR